MNKAVRTGLLRMWVLGLILALTACGSPAPAGAGNSKAAVADAKPAATAAPKPTDKPAAIVNGKDSTIKVKIKTYGIMLDVAQVPAGNVTFQATNTATDLEHEMVVIRTDLAPNALPYNDATKQVVEDNLNRLGEIGEMKPGTSGSVTLSMPPGKYLLICNILSHYKQGMATPIVVTS